MKNSSFLIRLILLPHGHGHGPDVPTSADNQSLVTIWIGTVSYTSSNDLTKHSNQLLCQKTFWMLPKSPPKGAKSGPPNTQQGTRSPALSVSPGLAGSKVIPSIWLHLGHTSAASLRQLSKLLMGNKTGGIPTATKTCKQINSIQKFYTYCCDWTPSFHRDVTHLAIGISHDLPSEVSINAFWPRRPLHWLFVSFQLTRSKTTRTAHECPMSLARVWS